MGGRDDRVGTVVINCDKGDCGRHTERDLVDFEIHLIDTSYLKATRKKKTGAKLGECSGTLLEMRWTVLKVACINS